MHHLTDIRIRNFRSCRNVDLSLDHCTPIVGYNNAGKSNIMSAVAWLVNPRSLSSDEFFDPNAPVTVGGTIEGLDEALLAKLDAKHQRKLTPFIRANKLVLRRTLDQPGGVKSIRLEVRDPEVDEHQEGAWRVNPTGIPAAIQALFPEPIFVGAMQDAAEDASKSKTGTTLGKLLAEMTEPIEQAHGDELGHLLDSMKKYLAPDGEDRVSELKRFDEEASNVLRDFFPGINLHLDIPVPEPKALFKLGTVRISEAGRDSIRDFTSLGHGAQRSIQMALIRYLADIKSNANDDSQRRLLLIEEPELFLHPQAVEQLRAALTKLSGGAYQVVFVTHSPMMVDRKSIAEARIVRKCPSNGQTLVIPSMGEALHKRITDEDTQLHTAFDLANASGWLFSDKVIIVEGKTERRILPVLYEAIMGCTLSADRIATVTLEGVGGMKGMLGVFQELGIEAFGIADFDYAPSQATKHGLLARGDDDLRQCLSQIAAMADRDSDINIGGDGRPTRKSATKKAAQVYAEWAATGEGKPVAERLHEKLKAHNVWIWPQGDIEAVLGLSGVKDEREWAEFCKRLDEGELGDVAESLPVVREFVEWFSDAPQLHASSTL